MRTHICKIILLLFFVFNPLKYFLPWLEIGVFIGSEKLKKTGLSKIYDHTYICARLPVCMHNHSAYIYPIIEINMGEKTENLKMLYRTVSLVYFCCIELDASLSNVQINDMPI